jgi:hypothetical protein
VFGCDAFVHQDRTQRDTTFSPKAEPAIYLGHDSRQNCPVVRMLHSGKTMRVKDVLFREGSFRHMRAELKGSAEQVESLDLSTTELEASERRHDPASVLPEDEHADTDHNSPESDHELDSHSEEEHSESKESDVDSSKRRYRVKSITDKRTTAGGQVEYRVKWVGHSAATWEPADAIEEDAPDAVKDYATFIERMSEARVTRSRAHAQAKAAAASAAPVAAAAATESDDRDSGSAASLSGASSSSDSTSLTEAARLAAAKCL